MLAECKINYLWDGKQHLDVGGDIHIILKSDFISAKVVEACENMWHPDLTQLKTGTTTNIICIMISYDWMWLILTLLKADGCTDWSKQTETLVYITHESNVPGKPLQMQPHKEKGCKNIYC